MDNEEIKYSFTGDCTDLVAATTQAITSMDSYERSIANVETRMASYNQGINAMFSFMAQLFEWVQKVTSAVDSQNQLFTSSSTHTAQWEAAVRQAQLAQGGLQGSVKKTSDAVDDNNKKNDEGKKKAEDLFKALKDLEKSFSDLFKKTSESNSALDGISKVLSEASGAAKAFLGIDIASTFKNAVTESMNYIENMNLFTVVMGEAADSGLEFINAMQEMYGLDTSNILAYTSSFQSLAIAANMSDKAAADLSTGMMSLAVDLSSLYNVDVSTVMTRMRSAMLGLQKSASQLGADIRVSTLQLYANKLGIEGNVSAMSEANREALRYIAMVDELKFANGDWAKTIESPSNQLRILKEQLTTTSRAIGNIFLKSIAAVLPYLNGLVMAIGKVITWIGALFGVDWSSGFEGSTSKVEDLSGSVDGVTDSAKKAAKAAKDLTAPFDELNVISQQDSSSSDSSGTSGSGSSGSMELDPALAEAIASLNTGLTEVSMKATQVRDNILSFLNLNKGPLLVLLENIQKWGESLKSLFGTIKEKISEAFSTNDNGYTIWSNLVGIVSDLVAWFTRLADTTKEWLAGVDFTPLADSMAKLSDALRNAFQAGEDSGEDFYNNVILKFSEWTIEEAVPETLDKIADVLQWFADHPGVGETILAVATAIAIVVATIKTVITVVKAVSTAVKAVRTVVSILGGSTTVIIAAIIVAIVAVIAIIILVLTHLDEIKAWWAKLPTVVKTPMAIIVGVIGGIFGTIKGIWKSVSTYFVDTWKDSIKNFKSIFSSIVDFIKAIANKDFKGAMKALANIVISIGNTIIDKVGNIINFVYNILASFINGIGSAIKAAGKVIGKDWGFTVKNKLDFTKYHIAKLATGGVVTKPTNAIIGEGRYNEAVIPLGNSPQLNEMLNKFAAKVAETPVNTVVYIGDQKWNSFTQKSARLGKRSLGTPVVGGGYYG